MTISEKIAQIRPLIGYDTNKDIRDTVNIYDFKRAVEFSVREMCKKAKVNLRSVFIPFVQNSQFTLLQLESMGALGFEVVAIKNIHLKSSDGSTTEITEEEIENVISDTYNLDLELYRMGVRKLGTSIRIQSNFLVTDQPVAGTFSSITAFPTAAKITLASGSSTVGYNVINLSKANENKYSYATITGVSGSDLTFADSIQTDTNYLWEVGDKIYVVNGLPYLTTVTFQGLPKTNYFDTYTTIPIDDVYLDYIEPIALEYLYAIIKGRFPEYNQMYLNQRAITKDIIKDVKLLANRRTGYTKVKPFIPFIQHYGR